MPAEYTLRDLMDGKVGAVSAPWFAAHFGVGINGVYDLIRRGELEHRNVGRRLLIPAGAVLKWAGYEPR